MAKTTTNPSAGGEAQIKLKRKNSVWVEGVLKTNSLEEVSLKGINTIRGEITVSVDEINSFKFRVFVPASRNGVETPVYKDFASLLPANTLSIAQYQETTPTANFATALQMATKVYVSGYMEEFVSKKDDKEKSFVTFTARKAGVKTLGHEFNPRSSFNCDLYIESMKDEVNADGDETGRVAIVGLLPAYDGCMHRFTFYTEAGQVTDYVKDNYSVGQTANFDGSIQAVKKEFSTTHAKSSTGWGSAQFSAPKTTFITQLIITGGKGKAIDPDEPGAILASDVKEGLLIREEKALENGDRKSSAKAVAPSSAATPSNPTEAPVAAKPVAAAPAGNKNFDFSDF